MPDELEADGGEEGPGDPFSPGWWVGSDGNWHTPDESFAPDVVHRRHPVRRVVVVVLAIALIGATSAGVWSGVATPPSPPTGPPLSRVEAQVREAVAGSGSTEPGVNGAVGAVCHPPTSWITGRRFRCDVFGSAGQRLGEYDATVEPSVAGEWRWSGVWEPNHHGAVTTI